MPFTGRDAHALTRLLLAGVTAGTLGCAATGRCPTGEGYRAVACLTERNLEGLVFGMSRDDALAMMGHTEVEPPWRNARGAGPEMLANPFDSREVESALGEEYEVVRFFVKVYGTPDCPFVQGRVELEPLIFIGGKLVGWDWSYLEDILEHPLEDDDRVWSFGAFCAARRYVAPPEAGVDEPIQPEIEAEIR